MKKILKRVLLGQPSCRSIVIGSVLAIHHARAMIGGFDEGNGRFKYGKNGAKNDGIKSD